MFITRHMPDTALVSSIPQITDVRNDDLKNALLPEFRQRLVLKLYFSGKNKIGAISSLAYVFKILLWTETEFGRRIGTIFSLFREYQPNFAVQWMNLPRDNGGKSVINVAAHHHSLVTCYALTFITKTG